MYGLNYDGLRKKETYDELVNYIMNEQEIIKYPDRTAKFLRESPQLSNLLDGDGEGILEMEKQQKRQMQAVELEHAIRRVAGRVTGSTAELRASGGLFDTDPGDNVSMSPDIHRGGDANLGEEKDEFDIFDEQEKERERQKQAKEELIRKAVDETLSGIVDKVVGESVAAKEKAREELIRKAVEKTLSGIVDKVVGESAKEELIRKDVEKAKAVAKEKATKEKEIEESEISTNVPEGSDLASIKSSGKGKGGGRPAIYVDRAKIEEKDLNVDFLKKYTVEGLKQQLLLFHNINVDKGDRRPESGMLNKDGMIAILKDEIKKKHKGLYQVGGSSSSGVVIEPTVPVPKRISVIESIVKGKGKKSK